MSNLIIIVGKQIIVTCEDSLTLPDVDTLTAFPDLVEYRDNIIPLDDGNLLLDIGHQEVIHANLYCVSLRDFLMLYCPQRFNAVARAWQYALFLRTHRFCGQCGERTRQINWEMAKQCDSCGHRSYPRVSPCIIVAIRKGRQILLAQGARHVKSGLFSTLAGFVESSENLEHAVAREVMEEVSIKVKNIEYFGSQPWPFPHSLMVGFIAEYDSGEIKVDGKEILEAHWYDVDNLPLVPETVSIAGRLIEHTQQLCRAHD